MGICQFVSGAHSEQVLRTYVLLLSDNVNSRNYEYYTVCDISMCCSMDLSMYSNVYEDCVINHRRDVLDCSLIWIVWPVSAGHRLV